MMPFCGGWELLVKIAETISWSCDCDSDLMKIVYVEKKATPKNNFKPFVGLIFRSEWSASGKKSGEIADY